MMKEKKCVFSEEQREIRFAAGLLTLEQLNSIDNFYRGVTVCPPRNEDQCTNRNNLSNLKDPSNFRPQSSYRE